MWAGGRRAVSICRVDEPKSFCGDQPTCEPSGFASLGDVESARTQLLEIFTPGGFEGFHIAAGEPATHSGLPEPSPPDIDKLMRHADEYRCRIIGPPVGLG